MRLFLMPFLFVVLSAGLSFGQNTSGTLVGHIADSAGAALTAAKVTITNTDTAEVRTTLTDSLGDYAVSLLKPGNYQVTIAAIGFKSQTRSGIVLNIAQTIRTDLSLTVGQTTDSITVSSSALALDTDSAEVGQVITEKQVSDLPLNGRNFQDLLLLAPGAVNNSGGEQSDFRIVISGGSDSSISLGGARGSSNGYTVDGTTILDIGYDTPAFAPSLDDIAEFKEQTKSYSAAYGYSANQVNITSKSGTNALHGTGFEFLRNTAADAAPHGATPGVTIPLLQRNQFGYALGGPVRIPKLYNGHNKTFFFANYEGFRQLIAGGSTAFVPTSDELKGIFSPAILGTFTAQSATTQCGHTYLAGDAHPLFDPQTGCPFPVDGNGNYVIPTNRISRIGQLVQRPGLYFPAGPDINSAAFGQPNYAINSSARLDYDQQNYRIDEIFSNKDSIFFHAVKHDESQSNGALTPVSGSIQTQPARLYTLTETHLFSPNFTNQFRLGYLEALYTTGPQKTIAAADLALINFPNDFHQPNEGYAEIQFASSPLNNGLVYSQVGSSAPPSFSNQPVWDIGESAIYSWKRHTISFGFDIRTIHLDLQNCCGLGRVNFDGQFSGDAFADLLLGAVSNLGLAQVGPQTNPLTGPTPHIHFRTWAPYVQDDWKVTQRLTVNLGLRYEYESVPYEEQNLFIWPDFSAPGGAFYVANKNIVTNYGGTNPFGPGGLYVSPPNGMRGPGPAPKNDLLPRIGFAFRPFNSAKTVVRGGYGIFFDTIEANEYQASAGFYPLTSSFTTTSIPLTYPPTYNTDNLPVATAAGPITSYATNPTSPLGFQQVQPTHTQNPYVQSWNFGVEQELPTHTTFEIDYIGNKADHLFSRSNPNQPTQCIPSLGCTVTTTTPATIPWQMRTPYPNMGTLIYAGFDGYSNYNAMDVKLEHRARDLTFLAAYTWSKELDTKSSVAGFAGDDAGWAGPQDSHNLRAEYARGNFDVGQRLALSAVYELPVGRGKMILGNTSRGIDAVVGGWEVSGISTFQGGLPFTIIAADIQGANNTFAERADFVAGAASAGFHQSSRGETGATWFNTAEFVQPAPGFYGNSARDAVRAPGQINFDLSLIKNFNLSERVKLQVQGEAFNVLNHWNPGQPDNTLSDANFGKIFANNSQNAARIMQLGARINF